MTSKETDIDALCRAISRSYANTVCGLGRVIELTIEPATFTNIEQVIVNGIAGADEPIRVTVPWLMQTYADTNKGLSMDMLTEIALAIGFWLGITDNVYVIKDRADSLHVVNRLFVNTNDFKITGGDIEKPDRWMSPFICINDPTT